MIKTFTLKSYKSKSLSGNITIPGDKSISIRAVIIASISYGNTKIFGLLESDDVKDTITALKFLGIEIRKTKVYFLVKGNGGVFSNNEKNLYFGNSGTASRLMCGVLCSRDVNIVIKGDYSLSNRPMQRIIDPLKKLGANLTTNTGKLPISIKKTKNIAPNTVTSKLGSAQVKSAVVLAALNIKGKTTFKEFSPSRNHTEIMLNYLGANIKVTKFKNYNKIVVVGPCVLKAQEIRVPGDFSSAAFLIVATLICSDSKVRIKNVGLNYFRVGLLEILKKMNAKIKVVKEYYVNGERVGDIEVESSKLIGICDDGKMSTRLIDEYPILFVAASFAKGNTIFRGLGELKVKESNRLDAMSKALSESGVKVEVKKNSIKIFGQKSHSGGIRINTFKDHRIAMAMIIFGLASKKPIKIDEMDMIFTSFPSFYNVLQKIGAKVEKIPK